MELVEVDDLIVIILEVKQINNLLFFLFLQWENYYVTILIIIHIYYT